MTAGHQGVGALGSFGGTGHHFMGDGAGKENHQIRGADLLFEIGGHFGEDLGPAAVGFAKGLVLPLHSFISAYNDDTHEKAPFGGHDVSID